VFVFQVIVQGTLETIITPEKTVWYDYEFNCKPGNIHRRPCIISPYHYRLDWLMWFAAFQSYQQCPWLIRLIDKLLEGDAIARKLLAYEDGDPFVVMQREAHINSKLLEDDKNATAILPTYIRAQLYEVL
jgi:hypothetical protein